jgi:hypothetical protein
MLNAGFIFIAPGADPAVHREHGGDPRRPPDRHRRGDYAQGAAAAKERAAAGCTAIELCGGFGIRGTALVAGPWRKRRGSAPCASICTRDLTAAAETIYSNPGEPPPAARRS